MDGSATTTMLASRMTMKNAPQSSASAHQRRGSGVTGPVSGMGRTSLAKAK